MKEPHEMRPGNRYAREARDQRTLSELARLKMALVAVCRRCKHRRLLYPAALAYQLGKDFKVIDLRHRLRCAGCCGYGTANVYESVR